MITLGVLCKNDQEQLRRCVDSCEGLINCVIVVDTGSHDILDTYRAVSHLSTHHVVERAWVDFGHNRNELLRILASHDPGGYGLLLDCDMTLEGSWPELTASAYMLEIEDGSPVRYSLPLLVRLDQELAYVGKTHEYLMGWGYSEPVDSMVVRHHCDGSRRPDKFKEDVVTLLEEHERDPKNARVVFYLANSLRDLGYNELAVKFYWMRSKMGGWDAEVNTSLEQVRRLMRGDREPTQVP